MIHSTQIVILKKYVVYVGIQNLKLMTFKKGYKKI